MKSLALIALITIVPAALIVMAPAAKADDALLGKWTTGFTTSTNPGPFNVSQKTTYNFAADKVNMDIDIIADILGRKQSERMTIVLSYMLGSPNAVGTPFDLTILRVLETPQSANLVFEHNENKYCGFSDWKLGQPKDVTGMSCPSRDNDPEATVYPSAGDRGYDIYKIEGDTLYMGTTSDNEEGTPNVPENRPTKVDRAVPYSRL